MKKSFFYSLTIVLLFSSIGHAQSDTSKLYSEAYGASSDPAILFVHGGPGYNSFTFEHSTARDLADDGFYVIVFDQRGCGRSSDVKKATYTFEKAYSDINHILDQYEIETVTLIGHSWGGTVCVKYAESFPNKVRNIILTDAPISYQRTFKTIMTKCKSIYAKKDTNQLKYIEMLEDMDSSSIMFSSYCFMHAMNCGFYQTEEPTQQAERIYKEMKQSDQAPLLSRMTREPVAGFHKNEQYTLIDLEESIKNIQDDLKIYGIYGVEDGLFDKAEFERLKKLFGPEQFLLVENASHSVFIDQQNQFIEAVSRFANE